MAVAYPTGMPIPLVSGYSQNDASKVNRVEVESGMPRFELMTENGYAGFKISWIFSQLEFQVFEGWFKYGLDYGRLSFDMTLKIGGGLKSHELIFMGDYQASLIGKKWRVSASLVSLVKQYDDLATFQAAKDLLCPPPAIGEFYWPFDEVQVQPFYAPASPDYWVLASAVSIAIGDTVEFEYYAFETPDDDGVAITSADGVNYFGVTGKIHPRQAIMVGFTATINGVATANGDPVPTSATNPAPPTAPPDKDGRYHFHKVILTATVATDINILGRDSTESALLAFNQPIFNFKINTVAQNYSWPMNNTASAAQPEVNVGSNNLVIQSYNSLQWRYTGVFFERQRNDERLDFYIRTFHPSKAEADLTIAQPSIRADGVGACYDNTKINGDPSPIIASHSNATYIDYSSGVTFEFLFKYVKVPVPASTAGGIIGGMDSLRAGSRIMALRFDNWDQANATDAVYTPRFAFPLRTNNFLFWSNRNTDLNVEIRGSEEIVLNETYMMIGTIRRSTKEAELWVGNRTSGVMVSIGTVSLPDSWWNFSGDLSVYDLVSGVETIQNQTGVDFAGTSFDQNCIQFQDVRIHLLEADQAFATQQFEAALVNT